MMYKMFALYRNPSDTAAFRHHYETIHAPLARKLPGLRQLMIGWGVAPPWGGEPTFHLIAEMDFDDAQAFAAAAASPEMRAVTKNARAFAGDILTVATVAAGS